MYIYRVCIHITDVHAYHKSGYKVNPSIALEIIHITLLSGI